MIVIMGPTACGKSAAGLFVAEAVSGEIVSADSMQIYKGMDTGTATPTKAERARVPHHLIDIRYPWESYDAATFARDATAAARAIEHRGRVAVVVGGTALYLKALLEGLFDGPPADARVRRRLRAAAAADGSAALHHMLAEVDPESAAKLHPNDLLRIVRALEVYECTGRPLSSYQTQFGRPREDLSAQALCLCRDRGDLDARIDRRVDHMFAEGLVQEVRALAEHPAGLGPTAAHALGYPQVLAHLAGRLSQSACVTAVKQATRRFARKQMNWFRRFGGIPRVHVSANEPTSSVGARLLDTLGLAPGAGAKKA